MDDKDQITKDPIILAATSFTAITKLSFCGVTIEKGKVTLEDGFTIDEAAIQFWETIEKHGSFKAPDDLPFREKDIRRALILFRTSNNAYGFTNSEILTERVDNLPPVAKLELIRTMRNIADGLEADLRSKEPSLSVADKAAQAARCGCGGADDLCVYQNVADATTRSERCAAFLDEGVSQEGDA